MSDSEYEAKEYMDSHHYCHEDHRGSFENGMASQAQTRNLLDGLLEIDRCATTIIGSHDAADYSVAVEQAERIGMIVTQLAGPVDTAFMERNMTNQEFFDKQNEAVRSFASSLVYAVTDMAADGVELEISCRSRAYLVSVSQITKQEQKIAPVTA